jgi:hypothetical protein
MIRLTKLPLPVSKNALHIPIRCGKWTKMVRSKKAKLRGEMIITHIWKQLGGRLHEPIITRPAQIHWTITFPDNRKRDRANYYEHLCDLLQEAKVIADDCLLVHENGEEMPQRIKPGWIDLTLEELP